MAANLIFQFLFVAPLRLPVFAVTVKSDLCAAGDNLLEKTTVFGGFGRATRDQVKNGTGWIYTHRIYDAANRVWKSSNPTSIAVCNTTTPCNFTETSYDGAGRPLQVTAPDGAKTTISYSNNETTTTDLRHSRKLTQVCLAELTHEFVHKTGGGLAVWLPAPRPGAVERRTKGESGAP